MLKLPDLIKLFSVNLLTLFKSFIFSQDRKIMNALIKWSSLQKSVIKFTPKKFYEIDPRIIMLGMFTFGVVTFGIIT